MEESIKVIDAYNLGDSWYWDCRCLFNYKGQYFGLLEYGSCSGYIPVGREIAHIAKEDYKAWLHSAEDCVDPDGYEPDETLLKRLADKLIESGNRYLRESENDSW